MSLGQWQGTRSIHCLLYIAGEVVPMAVVTMKMSCGEVLVEVVYRGAEIFFCLESIFSENNLSKKYVKSGNFKSRQNHRKYFF